METAEPPKIPTTAQRKSPTPATEDRISYLPDEILAHILFLLPTKHAVATSVLSRRWKDVWTGVYNLHLDFNNRFGESEIVANAQEIRERRYLEFCRFVDTVLRRHKNLNSVRRFHFHFAMKDVGCKVRPNFWLQMGFSPDESQLEVMDVELRGDEWNDDPFSLRCLPESFYRLKNLKILKLAGVSLETRIGSIFLPSVRKLLLLYAVIKSCASLSKLISGCPVLETLQIESCRHSNKEENDTLNAFLPCLKKLTIIGDIFYHDHCIVIDAPSLEHLYLDEYPELQLSQDGSRPLQCLHSALLEQGESGISNRGLTRLLAQISNAKVLCLSWRTLNLLSNGARLPIIPNDDAVARLPMFPNVKHLTIGSPASRSTLYYLLNSVPKLQSLVINLDDGWGMLDWRGSEEPACTPECLLSSLEEIEINYLVADNAELEMGACLLEAGVALKKANLHIMYDDSSLYDEYRHYMNDIHNRLGSLVKLVRSSRAYEIHLFLPDGDEIHVDSDDQTDGNDDVDGMDDDDANNDGADNDNGNVVGDDK